VELLDADPDDREASTCSGSQRSGGKGGPQVGACGDRSRKTGGAESADRNIVENGRQPSKIPIGFVRAFKKINEFLINL